MRLRRLPLPAVLAALAAPLVLAQPSFAARLPDWARPVADGAPPVTEGVSKHPSRVLFVEMRYAVQPDGSMRIRRRFASQALSVSADEVGIGVYHFADTAKVTASRAWHLPPGEKAERNWTPPIDVTTGRAFLSDTQARVIHVDDVVKGSLVFFEFEVTDRTRFLPLSFPFYEDAPVTLARMELETPPGWTVRSAWLRQPGPEAVVAGNVRSWELKDLPAPEKEPLGEDPADRAPLLVVNILPPAGVSISPAFFQDWAALSAWYEEVIGGRREVTPGIEAAMRKAVGEAPAGFFERVRAAGKFVRDGVRYVAVELGIGGYQPRPATETLANLYGDCKDKATLFQSMLAADGIPSYPVLINLYQRDTVALDVPNPGAFSHVVAAVPVPADAAIPLAFAAAVADAGDLGKVIIVDTTDERTSIGSLSAYLAGRRALLVAGDKGRIITLPVGDPSTHRLERTIRADLGPDRSISMERSSRFLGAFAWNARDQYGTSAVDRRKTVEQTITRSWPDATVQEYAAEYETPDGTFIETAKFSLRPLPPSGVGAKVEIFPGAADDIQRVPLGKRKTAVNYGHPMSIRYEMIFKGLPETAALPAPQEVQGAGWSVKTDYARKEKEIVATWEVTLARTHFELEEFPELRKLWSAAASAANGMLSP